MPSVDQLVGLQPVLLEARFQSGQMWSTFPYLSFLLRRLQARSSPQRCRKTLGPTCNHTTVVIQHGPRHLWTHLDRGTFALLAQHLSHNLGLAFQGFSKGGHRVNRTASVGTRVLFKFRNSPSQLSHRCWATFGKPLIRRLPFPMASRSDFLTVLWLKRQVLRAEPLEPFPESFGRREQLLCCLTQTSTARLDHGHKHVQPLPVLLFLALWRILNSRKDPFKSTSCSSSGLPYTCFSNSAWAALRSISFSSTASPSRPKASAKQYNRFANFCGLSFSGSYGRLRTSFSFSTDGFRKTDSSPTVEEAPDGAARAARPLPPSPPWLGPAGSGPGPGALRSSSLSSFFSVAHLLLLPRHRELHPRGPADPSNRPRKGLPWRLATVALLLSSSLLLDHHAEPCLAAAPLWRAKSSSHGTLSALGVVRPHPLWLVEEALLNLSLLVPSGGEHWASTASRWASGLTLHRWAVRLNLLGSPLKWISQNSTQLRSQRGFQRYSRSQSAFVASVETSCVLSQNKAVALQWQHENHRDH